MYYILFVLFTETQIFQKQNKLIDEQKVNDLHPFYTSTTVTRRHVMQSDIHHSSVLTTPAHRQHQNRVSRHNL